ncbi:MAG: hypothetical protein HZB55_04760 [Deltaproteobacteria bacterium]|nr:hypothetical protein [Deltaproteobacteria bacterium]
MNTEICWSFMTSSSSSGESAAAAKTPRSAVEFEAALLPNGRLTGLRHVGVIGKQGPYPLRPLDVVAGAVLGVVSSCLLTEPYDGWRVQVGADGQRYNVTVSRRF